MREDAGGEALIFQIGQARIEAAERFEIVAPDQQALIAIDRSGTVAGALGLDEAEQPLVTATGAQEAQGEVSGNVRVADNR